MKWPWKEVDERVFTLERKLRGMELKENGDTITAALKAIGGEKALNDPNVKAVFECYFSNRCSVLHPLRKHLAGRWGTLPE